MYRQKCMPYKSAPVIWSTLGSYTNSTVENLELLRSAVELHCVWANEKSAVRELKFEWTEV